MKQGVECMCVKKNERIHRNEKGMIKEERNLRLSIKIKVEVHKDKVFIAKKVTKKTVRSKKKQIGKAITNLGN